MNAWIALRLRLSLSILTGYSVVRPGMATASPGADAHRGACRSSSCWLSQGAALESRGEFVIAAQTYAEGLDALAERKKRSNVGANATRLSASAYWLAFESEGDIALLRAGIEQLERWLAMAGPNSQATRLTEIDRMASRLLAVHDALENMRDALESQDLDRARRDHDELLQSLSLMGRAWRIEARATIRLARGHIDAHPRSDSATEFEVRREQLDAARGYVEGSLGRRPSEDDSTEGPALEKLLAELDELIGERLPPPVPHEAATEERERGPAVIANKPHHRTDLILGSTFLSVGLAAIATGAGLLGESVVFSRIAERQITDARADLPTLDDQAAIDQFEARAYSRNSAFLTAGSVLLLGGATASTIGIVELIRARRGRAASLERARLHPSLSRSHVQLSLSLRF